MCEGRIRMSKLPVVQPGAKVEAYSIGTLGPLALTGKGDIVFTTTSHQIGPLKKGASLFLLPQNIPIGTFAKRHKIRYARNAKSTVKNSYTSMGLERKPYDSSLRISGIEDDLPVVLKGPVEPELNRSLIKSGAQTGVTYGAMIDANKEVIVEFSDGSVAVFTDQIMSEYMGTHGDSGSFVLTADTFEPVGLLFAGNQSVTFHNKLTNIAKLENLLGYFSPISLPTNTPSELRFIISTIIPDGFFFQRTNLLAKDPNQILKELGVMEIVETTTGGYDVRYEDTIVTSHPHKIGDEGSFLNAAEGGVVGLDIGGNERKTVVMKIDKVMKALNLELITNFSYRSLTHVHMSGYWRTRCKRCNATIAPGSKCRFCRF